MPPKSRCLLLAILAATLVVVASCSDAEPAADPQSTVTSTSTVQPSATQTPSQAPGSIDVVAVDYRFDGIPETARVGTRLTFFNDSAVEFHELVLLRLDPSEDRTVDELAQLPFEDIDAASFGTVTSIGFAMPNSEQYSQIRGEPVLDEEGRYLIFCAINVGTDPEAARDAAGKGPARPIEGIPRHYEVGMMTEITVSG